MPTVSIPLKEAKPGMVLAEDLYMKDGKIILCKKGTVLTDKLIDRFENLGVECILINQDMSEEERKAALEEKLKLIEQAFLNKQGRCVNMIKKALISYWNKKFLTNE